MATGRFITIDEAEYRELRSVNADLLDALQELLARADVLIFRPPVDDARLIDRDTRALRVVLEPARAAIARAKGGK
jgi:hypothetical protein